MEAKLTSHQFHTATSLEEKRELSKRRLQGWEIMCFRLPKVEYNEKSDTFNLGKVLLKTPGEMNFLLSGTVKKKYHQDPYVHFITKGVLTGTLDPLDTDVLAFACADHWSQCQAYLLWTTRGAATLRQVRSQPDAFFSFWQPESTRPPDRAFSHGGLGQFRDSREVPPSYPLSKRRDAGADGE